MLKKVKTENRNVYQNRKTGNFECKNRKTDLKNDHNRKTENPNAPLLHPYLPITATSLQRPLHLCPQVGRCGEVRLYKKRAKRI